MAQVETGYRQARSTLLVRFVLGPCSERCELLRRVTRVLPASGEVPAAAVQRRHQSEVRDRHHVHHRRQHGRHGG